MRKIKVILQKDYASLGFIGDEVEVRGGYARNFLLPNNIAFEAARTDKGYAKHKLASVLNKRKRLRSDAENMLKTIEGLIPEFTLKIGDAGKTFGSITNRDVAKWLDEKGHAIDRSQIVLTEPVKKAGEHQIKIRLHSEVTANMKIRVTAEAPVVAAPVETERPARGRGRGRSRKNDQQEAGQSEETTNTTDAA